MQDPTITVDTGGLTQPATTLVERISDAIGGICLPWQIKRVAEAEAKADIIRAEAHIEVSQLQRRALHRFMIEEALKQGNMEAITQKALPEVGEKATPENIEKDWITNFFDKCRLVSDQDMQTLWAKVLAGEANTPGKYSKRTVNFLASLDKSDAESFAKLCSFQFNMGGPTVLVYNYRDDIYQRHGISFEQLVNLEALGLIKYSASGYSTTLSFPNGMIRYFSEFVWMGLKTGNQFNIGTVMFTRAGVELAPICGSQAVDGFVDYVRSHWKRLNYYTDPKEGDESSIEGE